MYNKTSEKSSFLGLLLFIYIDRFIGGLYGRALGRLLVELHGGVPTELFWQWIDPGALALIGSASFFGGVSRLTMSLTVIMVGYVLLIYDMSVVIYDIIYR